MRTALDGKSDRLVAIVARRTIVNLRDWCLAPVRSPRRIHPMPLLPVTATLALGALAAAAAIAVSMLFVDAGLIAFAGTLPRWLVETFNEITDFGRSGWFLFPAAVLILVAAALSTPAIGRLTNLVLISLVVRVGFVFAAVAIPGLLVTIVKRLIGRARPSDLGPFAYEPFAWRAEYAGMPSGHSTTAFAAAFAIGAIWPRARIPMWTYAVIIAISRVVITAHYPSDVIAGAMFGTFAALLVRNWFAARRLGFAVGLDGKVHASPGPSLRRVKTVARRLIGQ